MIPYQDILTRYGNFFEDVFNKNPDPAKIDAYLKVVEEKEAYQESWGNLLAELEESGRYHRIRGCGQATVPHCFRVVLPFRSENHQGLMLCISMTGKLIGIYFSDYTKKTLVPIHLGWNTNPEVVSYYPFSPWQEDEARFVLGLVHRHFPEFQKFDNTYASVPVSNIIFGEQTYREVDLFQAIFSANVHGMI